MKTSRLFFILGIFLIVALNACTTYEYQPTSLTCPDGTVLTCPSDDNQTSLEGNELEMNHDQEQEKEQEEQPDEEEQEEQPEEEEQEQEEEEQEQEEEEQEQEEEQEADITVVEGELVDIDPQVTDPDGDELSIEFSEPLNEDGEWQTEQGDAGLYTATITVSDGVSTVEREITILVLPGNMPPEIGIEETLEYDEGDRIVLDPEITDPDDENVTVSYSGWIKSSVYETDYDDAGEYTVTITASDGTSTVEKEITIVVNNVNRKPVLELLNVEDGMLEITEGQTAMIIAEASDPDGDEISINFSEPFDENGEWETEEGDAGEQVVTVTANDGEARTRNEVLVIVNPQNMPPEFEEIDVVVVNVDDNLMDYIKPEATDPEGEEVIISYSGWVDDIDYVAKEEDAGTHEITITYSDGVNEVEQVVSVRVNRPPTFEI
ncbi:hypothetical protein GF327_01985 [Candidatus Woesearchaeota archaeon]|nr:hypothetical protein [Candidatus Woesearchaeota archaeon]